MNTAPDTFSAVPFLLVFALGWLAFAANRRRRVCRRCNGAGLIPAGRFGLRSSWRLCPRCQGRTRRTPHTPTPTRSPGQHPDRWSDGPTRRSPR